MKINKKTVTPGYAKEDTSKKIGDIKINNVEKEATSPMIRGDFKVTKTIPKTVLLRKSTDNTTKEQKSHNKVQNDIRKVDSKLGLFLNVFHL